MQQRPPALTETGAALRRDGTGVLAAGTLMKGGSPAWRLRLGAILLAGLALRLLFLPLAGSRQDNLDFQRWGDSAISAGFDGLYTRDALVLNYPPAYLYPLALDGLLHRVLAHAAGRPWPPATLDPAFFMLQKLNPIAADLLAAALLAGGLRRRVGPGRALAGAGVYALNPALIYTSGYWGQADGVVLAMLTAAFLAITARRPVVAGALLGLALVTKPQAGLFVPLLGLFLLAQPAGGSNARRLPPWLQASLAAAVVGAGLIAPFWLGASGARVFEPYTRAVGHFTLVALNAFNGWWLLYGEAAGGVEDSTVLLAGLTARQVGLGLLASALALLVAFYGRALWRRRQDAPSTLPYIAALAWAAAALAFFWLPTQVHERYALYALPPLLLVALWQPGRAHRALALVAGVSVLMWLNLSYITPLVPLARPIQQFMGDVLGRGVALLFLAALLACGWGLLRAGARPATRPPPGARPG
jgi:hypothetical protein